MTGAQKASRAAAVARTAFALATLLTVADDALGGGRAVDWARRLAVVVLVASLALWIGFRVRSAGLAMAITWLVALLVAGALVAAGAAVDRLLA